MIQRLTIVYSILIVGLILQPHIITGHIFLLSEEYAESISTILLLLFGYFVYYLHTKEINKLENKLDILNTKLNDAFKYIGIANRKLPLIYKITTNLLKRNPFNKKDKKNILNELLSTAVISVASVEWGIFRIINMKNGNTDKEFIMASRQYGILRTQISNKELIDHDGNGREMYQIGDVYVFRSADRQSNKQCFFLFPKSQKKLDDEISLLQSITDQAQLFYKYLY